ncbi:MAG: dephospho-CoA kinase [Pseudomonadales bacterium]
MAEIIIGLTGGIGSGKSAAADRFAQHGIQVIDADLASRAVVEPGQPALDAIAEHFGGAVIQSDGQLDRTALRHIVFADASERSWLQQLLHPHIDRYLTDGLKNATSAYAVLAHPLLFETRRHQQCARSLLIDVPEAIQLERTMSRDNNTREQVQNIMQAQSSREFRLARADDVIVNDASFEQLHHEVDLLHQQYLELCQN